MPELIVIVDEATEAGLQQMALQRNTTSTEMASRLLRRAVRAVQPRSVYDAVALRAYARENEAEELALANSDSVHRLELLEAEDRG